MHRSGTSSLAGSLRDAGLFFGAVTNAAPHNAKGNLENRAIRRFHTDILHDNKGGWDCPPNKITWSPAHRARRDALIESYPTDRIWGFKDPRTLLTLDGWLEVLPRAQCVGSFRHPLAVTRSLQTRDGFTREKCLDLWTKYNSLLLKYQRKFGFDLVCFDWPTDHYHRKLGEITLKLNLPQTQQKFSFFDPNLRNNSLSDSKDLPYSVRSLFCDLMDHCGQSPLPNDQ